MELREIRSLVALSELGSILLVAEHLHLSAPAIHKQLKVLESELGVCLYEKAGKQLKLSGAADTLLPYFKELLAHYDLAMSDLEEWKRMERGVVRIGTGPSAYVLPAILRQFRREYPGIEVLVETGNTPVLMKNLSRGSLDLVLIVSSELEERQQFAVEAVWDFQLVLVSHQRTTGQKLCLRDLKNHRFILFRSGSRMQEPVDRYFAQQCFDPKVAMRFDNAEFIRAMVRSGLGIALLPLWVVERDVREKNLSLVRLVEPYPSSRIALLRRKSNHIPRPVQGFINTATAVQPNELPLLSSSNTCPPLPFRKRE